MQIAISDLAVNDPTTNRNVLRSKIEQMDHVKSDKSDRNILDNVVFVAILRFCIFYSFWCERTVRPTHGSSAFFNFNCSAATPFSCMALQQEPEPLAWGTHI